MGTSGKSRSSGTVKKSQRRFIVFTTLVAVLTCTSALLLALAPAPLAPEASSSLFAVDAPQSLDVVFGTKAPTAVEKWKYIYIRHSKTQAGNALTLGQTAGGGMGDHFLIGNGDGCVDGEIQIGQRWNQQLSPAAPPGANEIDPGCITVCLVGDFDSTVPTPVQLRRLGQLVSTLQNRLQIPADHVLMIHQPNLPAGIGKYFPSAAFREQLQR